MMTVIIIRGHSSERIPSPRHCAMDREAYAALKCHVFLLIYYNGVRTRHFAVACKWFFKLHFDISLISHQRTNVVLCIN